MQQIRKQKRTVKRMTPEQQDVAREEVRVRLARKVARQRAADLVEAADETLEQVDKNLSALNNHTW
jgi:hypothetical protein